MEFLCRNKTLLVLLKLAEGLVFTEKTLENSVRHLLV